MSEQQEIRWVQRLRNYCEALDSLGEAVEIAGKRELSNLEKSGLIQNFVFTYDLSWRLIQEFFKEQEIVDIRGPRDAFTKVFGEGMVANDKLSKAIESRNKVVHTYNQEFAEKMCRDIRESYYTAFEELREAMLTEKEKRGL